MSELIINPKEIGERIKNLRLKLNKTQNYFADVLYISPSYLALIESGKRTPNLEILVQISIIAGVSIDYLATGKKDKEATPTQAIIDRLTRKYDQSEVEKALKIAEYYLQITNDEI